MSESENKTIMVLTDRPSRARNLFWILYLVGAFVAGSVLTYFWDKHTG